MTFMAESWHESGTFWTIFIAAVVAIAVALFSAWANLRTVRPKRRFTYCPRKNTSLLNTSRRAASSLIVTHGTTPLSRPRVVEVEVSNDGRAAITSQDFHNGDPVAFDVGARIVAILSAESSPSAHRVPPTSIDGQLFKIEPGLLSPRQSVSFSLLVDGPKSPLSCQASLVNVPVRERESNDPLLESQRAVKRIGIACAAGFMAAAFLTAYAWQITEDGRESLRKTQQLLETVKEIEKNLELEKDRLEKQLRQP